MNEGVYPWKAGDRGSMDGADGVERLTFTVEHVYSNGDIHVRIDQTQEDIDVGGDECDPVAVSS